MYASGELEVWNKGLTKETNESILRGSVKMNTQERAEKISKTLRNKPKSDNHKKQISKNFTKYWSSEENKEKASKRQTEWLMDNGEICYKQSKSGWYTCKKSMKIKAYYRSSYELNALKWLDSCSDVCSYIYEPFSIEYLFENKARNYLVDFAIEYADGRKVIVEIKPDGKLDTPKNKAKFSGAQAFAQEHDFEFEVWTEKTHPFLIEDN